ncbi:MAG: ABC transporter ATP-binding protein [Clostridia bacterium]|nr:ABC transporter ATP-binding protein [Clostridia bacterium]
MIEIKNFSKSYSDTVVYENFNLFLEEGEITCILGESGSGKTTLLNAVAGLIKYEGSISELNCSYIFQRPRLVPNLTVYENLKLVCDDVEKIKDMLERVSLTDKAGSYPIKLSGGQAQRVAIARAFLFPSDIILMDEPFSSLDLKLKKQITNLFFEIWREDKRTAIFVTHDVDEAVSVAKRIIVIDKGKVVFDKRTEDEPPRDFTKCENLRSELISVLLG